MELILTQDLDRSKISVNQKKLVSLLENLLEELIETSYRYVVRIEKLEEDRIKSYLITDNKTFIIGFELDKPNLIIVHEVGSDVFNGFVDIIDQEKKEQIKRWIGQTKRQDELRFKYFPFTKVKYKPTNEIGIVRFLYNDGDVDVLFDINSKPKRCKFEDLEIL